jgi:hypothetical protein
MSFHAYRIKRGVYLMPLVLALAFQPMALSQECGGDQCGACNTCNTCNTRDCPPPYRYCMERPPVIKFKCGCPKPVCPPDCNTPSWGYFEPCWRPWPWPRDVSHCPAPAPVGAVVLPMSDHMPMPAGEQIPAPVRVDPGARKSL